VNTGTYGEKYRTTQLPQEKENNKKLKSVIFDPPL
jgi:hypothetical protein